jgi:ribosomal protein L11 methyltransferase
VGGGDAGVIRLAVRVATADYERVIGELVELGTSGFEERELANGYEFVFYGAPGEVPALPALQAAVGGALVDVSTSEVADDWSEAWKSAHPPVDVGPIRVRAPWIESRGGIDVVIQPGRAFGTGQHATTRLCLELLLRVEPQGALADWGCGSGVLAVTAAKLGFDPVAACDVAAVSMDATRAAAEANGVQVDVTRCDLRHAAGPWAPTVTANLVRPLLLALGEQIERPPRRLIASGLLHDEADEVAAAFARHGLREEERLHEAEWAAILMSR